VLNNQFEVDDNLIHDAKDRGHGLPKIRLAPGITRRQGFEQIVGALAEAGAKPLT